MQIFISHSRKDEKLINRLKEGIGVMKFTPIVYEDLPKTGSSPDYQRIGSLIKNSDVVFLFLTKNVAKSDWTRYWVDHEVSQAAAYNKPLVEFQVEGEKPRLPIGYCTDVAQISRDPSTQVIQVQKIARGMEKKPLWIIGAVGGAAIGSIAGPIGTVLGAIYGGLIASDSGKSIVKTLLCEKDRMKYRYWGKIGTSFYCPHCMLEYEYRGGKDEH